MHSTSTNPAQQCDKYGRFPPECRFNVDQVPLAFDMGSGITWDEVGTKRCWIKMHLKGLEKRFCTLQMCICMDKTKPQPIKLAVVFRSGSKGTRIKKSEKDQYDKRVVVLWQKKAWMDRELCMQWAKEVWRKCTSRVDEKLLLFDNLDGQIDPPFKEYLTESCRTLPWYGPAGDTDEWQPVDHHCGKTLKGYCYDEYETYMEEFGDQWEDGVITMSEKRVLITKWVGAAWERQWREHSGMLESAFITTGCGITLDGSDDQKICPEGFPTDYYKLLEMDELPAEHTEAYAAAAAAANAAELQQIRQSEEVLGGAAAENASDLVDATNDIADEEEVGDDAQTRLLENCDESGSGSSSSEEDKEFEWVRIIGCWKIGNARKWMVEWRPEDCDEDDEQTEWVTFGSNDDTEPGVNFS
jgi:hypothetical protein